jgi:NAD(P)-dependent dehydrogenase (short-subunit alcohol dehydrogenase family)
VCVASVVAPRDSALASPQCNYFGPVALTYQLLGLLEASAPSRVINMSSVAEAFAVIDWDDLKCASCNAVPGACVFVHA